MAKHKKPANKIGRTRKANGRFGRKPRSGKKK